ncbi:efflux RND transporter periplasmic adaptor subunit [Thioalkalivibrio halophilus]|uniref:Efflux transporter periplasmic adaptor subunit n=1 Tax=Thioalkalivibrio halophilus TaxID=252474 RepID=A0A1V2ZX14_9GAMM|nr:HlyD family efflux transporter periplasmic adaptor subunit [Thioalkalivibrio halophilus]OOC09635.1 efflux transporter periplasmic adaptor subunit [Thioalkalivibrio halophilus]
MVLKKRITAGLVVLAGAAALVWALSPRPVAVAVSEVKSGPFTETLREEGRTRLRDTWEVSAPIAGFLHRVHLEEGDAVAAGDELFRMEPLPAPGLDARSREQAREHLAAARSRLQGARASLEDLRAEARLAESEYRRHRELFEDGAVSASDLERVETRRDRARSTVEAGESAVEVARSEVEAARVILDIATGERSEEEAESLAVRAPAGGVVLHRHRCCEGTVVAGEPVLELGDPADLEVQVDLLSMDAVRVTPDMRVRLIDWGGDEALEARVRRLRPAGFTRTSALGVDEQRVPVLLEVDAEEARKAGLVVGYHVEAEFLLWEGEDVLQIPTSALFREDGEWAVFVVEEGRAQPRRVEAGRRSDFTTQIREGLEAGERVVTRPGDQVQAGTRVIAD